MSLVTVTYEPSWRASYWDEDVPSREAWFVSCPEHPKLGKDNSGEPWGYARRRDANSVRTRHDRKHAGCYEPV